MRKIKIFFYEKYPPTITRADVLHPDRFQADPTMLDVTRTHPITWNKNTEAYFMSIPSTQWNSYVTYVTHVTMELIPFLATRTPPESYATFVRPSMLSEGKMRPLCPILELAKNAQFHKDKIIFLKQDWNRIMWPVVIAALATAAIFAFKILMNVKDDQCNTTEDLKTLGDDPEKFEHLNIPCNGLKYNSIQLVTLVISELAQIINAIFANLIQNRKKK